MEAQGDAALAERLYAEHATLRGMLAPGSGRAAADLQRFGELLEAHIKFEERELFEVAQVRLDAVALRAVAEACRARHDGSASA